MLLKIFFGLAMFGASLFLSSATFAYDYTGTDSNGDGVRDDVATKCAEIDTSSYKKNILLKQAKLLQRIMAADLDNTDYVKELGTEYMALMSCLAGVYTMNGEDPQFMQYSRSITEKTFDTGERNRKFHSFLARIEKMPLNESKVGTALCGK